MLPPTGLLFIPHVIYVYGELWWNDIYGGTPDSSSDLSGNLFSSHLVAKQEEMAQEMIKFSLRSISLILEGLFNMT
jgi:hypothetical protein